MKRESLLAYDVFAKTEEDVRIRTRTGGLITMLCCGFTFLLLLSEWFQFYKVVTKPDLVIDRDFHLKLNFNIDITFPFVPCELVNLDILDDSGNVQLDITNSDFLKTRIDRKGQPVGDSKKFKVSDDLSDFAPDDNDYCGSCYGAIDQSKNDGLEKKVCCQTCEDVRAAYLDAGWAFFDGKNIEQCERAGVVNKVKEQLDEGCRIQGETQLNRVHGNIHFAPGKAFHNRRGHFHDTSLYDNQDQLNFKHIINHLSFGKAVRELLGGDENSVAFTAPMDGHQELPDINGHWHQFSYFAKIIPTRFEYLNGKSEETSQLTITSHPKVVTSSDDASAILQARAGIPGLFIDYEISPLKVINKEEHALTWSGFLLNCITSIGGILAVGTVVDKIIYAAQRSSNGN